MTQLISNLLRRTLAVLGAAFALAWSFPAASQGTVTLSSGATCAYTSMTVQPNGTISVTCGATGTATAANFTIAGPATLAANTSGSVQIARSGGSDPTLLVSYQITGAGCNSASSTLSLAAGQSSTVTITTLASGSCTVAITPPSGHTANPNTVTITVGSSAPPPTTAGCPTPPVGTLARALGFNDAPDQLRMGTGVIAYYPVVASGDPARASVEFTQGQQAATPASVTTEFTVSKCPGVIDTSVPDCYYKNQLTNNNKITIYTRTIPAYGWNTQADMTGFGCLAPATDSTGAPQQWYVNVRWTYPSCPSSFTNGCGFSMQWAQGAW